ncbi:MAG: hypothetical protein DIU80_020450 [Chloroflexota bacterium]|nr:MAG: hypothetical protein DIU80_15740 [Chloroflexota bacterium]
MPDDPSTDRSSLRLVECWLPLAQELNEAQGWGDDGPALERLILAAASALSSAVSVESARAILLVYHASLRARPR